MPDVYSPDWYEAVRVAMNERATKLRQVPDGSFVIVIEIAGDGVSPYVAEAGQRRFVARIENGGCAWYREVGDAGEEHTLTDGRADYRFQGTASSFDELAAGVLDPIDAALRGTIKVRGDMRLLLRHAENVKALLEAYTSAVDTTWPKGCPPYGERAVIDGAPAHA